MENIANCNLTIYESPESLADKFSDLLMHWISLSGENRFHLAISGGSTPNLLFKALASKYTDSVLWEKAHFWWVDERMVSPDNPESNFGLANQLLFSKIAIPENNIHRIKGENDPLREAENYSGQMTELLRVQSGRPLLDLVILGIGEDGHTASIFPNQMGLLESDKICEVAYHPVTNQRRVTLTGSQINNASRICFLVTGTNKAERMSEIFSNDDKANALPAFHIRPLHGELAWYSDESAAKLLTQNNSYAQK